MTCILLVEDDDDVRETLESALSGQGHRVLAARNGVHAFEVVREHGFRPEVILLDLTMPQMSGEEFLEASADEPLLAQVPVIVDTARRTIPDPMPEVVKAVLVKPMHLGDLLRAIERCMLDTPPPAPAVANGTGTIPPLHGDPTDAPE